MVTAMALRVRQVSVDANGDSLDGDHYAEQVQLVTASRSLQLTLWELPIGTKIDHRDASTPAENTRQSSISVNARKLRSWKAHEAPVLAMAFDQTGTLLATGSADSTIRVFNVDRAACTHNLRGHRGLVSTLLFHPEAERWLLLSGGDDGRVKVWDLMTKKCRATLESHVSVVRAISVSDDGWTVVSGARDKVVCVWSLRDFQLISTIPVLETIEAVGVVGGGSGTSGHSTDIRFYTAGDKGTVRVWSTASGQCIYEQTLAVASTNSEGHAVTGALYLSATNTLVTTTVDHNINFYRLQSASTESITLERIRSVAGYCEEIADIAFVGPERDALAVVSNSEQLRVFDVNASGCTIVYGHSEPILCLDVSRDGRVIATGSKDKTARVWAYDDTSANWECIAVCAGHAEAVTGVSFSRKQADGVRFLMTVSKDRTFKRWDLSQLLGAEERVKTFYTNKAHEKDINAVTVAPNDRFFATASQDKLAKIWNVETGEVHGVLKGHRRGVWTVRFSPVDQVVATGSGDKTIKLWSLGDLTCLKVGRWSILSMIYAHHRSMVTHRPLKAIQTPWSALIILLLARSFLPRARMVSPNSGRSSPESAWRQWTVTMTRRGRCLCVNSGSASMANKRRPRRALLQLLEQTRKSFCTRTQPRRNIREGFASVKSFSFWNKT